MIKPKSKLSPDIAEVLEKLEEVAEAIRSGEHIDASELRGTVLFMRILNFVSSLRLSPYRLSSEDRAGLADAENILNSLANPNRKEPPS